LSRKGGGKEKERSELAKAGGGGGGEKAYETVSKAAYHGKAGPPKPVICYTRQLEKHRRASGNVREDNSKAGPTRGFRSALGARAGRRHSGKRKFRVLQSPMTAQAGRKGYERRGASLRDRILHDARVLTRIKTT